MGMVKKFTFAHVAEGIARQAGALLRGFYEKGVSTEYKGDVDIVTEADRASEELIVSKLKAAFPSHGIYGEEGTREWAGERVSVVCRSAGWDDELCAWVSGVLRGAGVGAQAAGLAADADGEMVAGVIYDPLRDEMFSVEKGKGAWLNQRQIHVSKTKTLQESLTGTGFPSQKRHASPNIHFYQQITLRSHGVRRAGSAALDLAYVACGRLDGFWEFNLNPWDTSAGVLLVEEAGGR